MSAVGVAQRPDEPIGRDAGYGVLRQPPEGLVRLLALGDAGDACDGPRLHALVIDQHEVVGRGGVGQVADAGGEACVIGGECPARVVGEQVRVTREWDDVGGDDHASTVAWIRWNARGSGRETTKKPRKNCGKITGKGLDNCHARSGCVRDSLQLKSTKKTKKPLAQARGVWVGWVGQFQPGIGPGRLRYAS